MGKTIAVRIKMNNGDIHDVYNTQSETVMGFVRKLNTRFLTWDDFSINTDLISSIKLIEDEVEDK